MPEEKIVNIGAPDNRMNTIHEDVYNFIMDRAEGLPIASVIGMLELLKYEIIESSD